MKFTTRAVLIVPLLLVAGSGRAQMSGWSGFSQEFLTECRAAQQQVSDTRSIDPLAGLKTKYPGAAEQAELELLMGLVYGQWSGFVDPAKAIPHFTATLEHDLPDDVRVNVFIWRGNAHEQLGHDEPALADYLRGLLICADYDLDGAWPEILDPKVHPSTRDTERIEDYNAYRRRLDLRQHLFMHRYFLVDAVKRVAKHEALAHTDLAELFARLSPETARLEAIKRLVAGENKRPWP